MIKKVTIKNFKSLKDVSFEVPSFAVLVGYNGSGKTNYVNALHLTSLLARGEQIEDALTKLDLISSELFFDTNNNKTDFEFDILLDDGTPMNYSFSIVQTIREEKMSYEVADERLVNGSKEKPILVRSQKQIMLGVEEESELKQTQLVANQLALSVFENPKSILETKKILSSLTICQLGAEFLRNLGTVTNIEGKLPQTLVESIFELQSKKRGAFDEFVTESKRIIRELESLEVEQEKERIQLNITEKTSGGRKFSSFSASDGNLRTLAILSSLLNEPKPSALIIDEIENSFHPERIKSLMEALKYIASTQGGKLQIVVTTHSPVVLNYVNSDDIVYVFKKDGATNITNPYKNKMVRTHLEQSEETGSKLGNLFANGVLEQIFTSGS